MDKMHASHRMGMQNQTFMKAAAIATWLGDFMTAWMVTDMMLQVNEGERGVGPTKFPLFCKETSHL